MTSRSSAELTSGASHIAYEVGQMLDAAQRIDAAKDTPTHHALLESALLHARSLIEFLLGRGRTTDIRAEHFLSAPWSLEDDELGARLAEYKLAIDAYLSHLTWKRIDPDDRRGWDYPNMLTDIVSGVRAFAALLERDSSPAAAVVRNALIQRRTAWIMHRSAGPGLSASTSPAGGTVVAWIPPDLSLRFPDD